MIKRALISVSNKDGLQEFAQGLHKLGIEIISTGGTAKFLQKANIPVINVADITEFPEIMEGRVKTLHPKIAGGILGKRDQHKKEAQEHKIPWIDLVVCNLYPFSETIAKPNIGLDSALENIDIGGPTMIRAAAKNFPWVGVIVDTNDYSPILMELQKNKKLALKLRKKLAAKAFAHTAQYDAKIADYLNDELFPHQLTLSFTKASDLRYGENPHQQACFYTKSGMPDFAKQHQGKQLSFNNIVDADAAITCLREFFDPACVVVKHANPCGVAEHENITQAVINAWETDAKSAFGGIVALNRACNKEIAEFLAKVFIEVLIAPSYSKEALAILQKKSNLRVLEMSSRGLAAGSRLQFKYINGSMLLQTADDYQLTKKDLKIVTKIKPSAKQIADMLFAWKVVKHVKSNGIVIAENRTTLGIGHGQVSRVDAVHIAIYKARKYPQEAVLASDAFFPFRDSIDPLEAANIKAIIQPGGSIRDDEVIAACDEHNIAMLFTGIRCFNH